MAGHKREAAVRCEVTNKQGEQCRTALSNGWTRCPHHTWKGAEQFATELENSETDIPVHAARHELLGLGLAVHDALADDRLDINTMAEALQRLDVESFDQSLHLDIAETERE
jgi:hypothetical protein